MRIADNTCPHCRSLMVRWANPEWSSWGGEFQFVCFNNECPYYVGGWAWMRDRYNVIASYRHRVDPLTGQRGPLPVWSPDDLRSNILPEEQEAALAC